MSFIIQDNNKSNEETPSAKTNEEIIELQLGDIINITNPKNDRLNEQTFIIDYIDKSKMILINTDTLDSIKLNISDNGIIGDGNISKLAILSRSNEKGYARQNNLLPDVWVDIHFSGDFPAIITGEITNLENDMIEIRTIDNDMLYLNFDYKGIPEDLPISMIEIREKPNIDASIQNLENLDIDKLEQEQSITIEEGEIIEEPNPKPISKDIIEINVPIINIKNQIREFILKADQIQFGKEELGPITQYVDVSNKSQRYSIESQVSDMLDDILSTIPNAQRTRKVLNNIHRIIERFKQLREHFSHFDEYGNVDGPIYYDARYKPLLNYFNHFSKNLYWILPVVKNIKKIYNAGSENDNGDNTDIVNLQLSSDLIHITDIINNYKSNSISNEINKYSQLYNDLNPYFTPFEIIDPENNKDLLIEKHTDCDINVIIDNLEDMYSSIFRKSNIINRRFIISKYNLGLYKLDSLDSSGSKMITTRVKMTEPDLMSIKSIITLPEPAIRFSKINLPNTTLLEKANLNMVFLNYWQFLNKNTKLDNVIVDVIDKDIEYKEDNFLNNIKNYILNLSSEQKNGFTNNEIYSKFIQTIVPKTKILFNLMKKYITGKLSIVDVVSYLEPFLIYTDNLTYLQYVEIINFIDIQISKYNQDLLKRSQIMKQLKYVKSANINFANVYNIISMLQDDKVKQEVFDHYNIQINKDNMILNNNEILCKLIKTDASRLYTSALSLKNISLMFPLKFISLFNDEKNEIGSKIKNEEGSNLCKEKIIAKKYSSIEELTLDNDKNIYFDKIYDKTNYNLLEKYEDQLIKMSPENFILFLKSELAKKLHLDDKSAEYLADTLINGMKKVINGQYAVVNIFKDNTSYGDYYIRENNKWVLDKSPPTDLFIDDSDVLCNIQSSCMSFPDDNNDNRCESLKLGELNIQDKLLKSVMNEFDSNYNVSKEKLINDITSLYENNLIIIDKLIHIENYNLIKYNNYKYKLGSVEEDNGTKITSPHSKLLNIILKQSDFVKKQYDIVRFVQTYTRNAITDGLGPLNTKESVYWLYCINSNVPILPIFRFNMASTYITNPAGYNEYVDILISKVGKLSDDGNLWTDEHSGWTIQKIEDDFDEGYEDGFKVISRAIIEDDVGNQIKIYNKDAKPTYETLESKIISNITNAISVAMGINIESQKEFIINGVLDTLKNTLESEEDYKKKMKEMAEKNRKMMSYNDFYNTALLFYTLGMCLIAIQTSIPSIKTRKTFPGCVKSFSGYPFEGAGDYSSLTYLSCITYDIKSSAEPWNVLKNKKIEYVYDKIKLCIDNELLNLQSVKEKFEQKTEYLLLNGNGDIPEEHNITKWSNFLPPLVPFKVTKLSNISSDFKNTLMNEMKNGIESQEIKLQVVRSKIMLFSLAIQEAIQNIVSKEALLIKKGNNEPSLVNACCGTNDKMSTIQYFSDKNSDIIEYNNIVIKLQNLIEDVNSITKSGILYSNINTKNKYPEITNDFDEKIIYLSFIHFCKFKSSMLIPEYLLPLCNDKPTSLLINYNDSVDEIIVKLKQDGRNYNNDTFLRLLQIIAKHHIINTNIESHATSSITKLSGLIKSIKDEKDELVDNELILLLLNLLDTFDIASNEVTKEAKALNKFLQDKNKEMKQTLVNFITTNNVVNISNNVLNKLVICIHNLEKWDNEKTNSTIMSNDNTYNCINFYKTYIHNFTEIFPNIILNKVDYQNVFIPNYLGLSSSHSNKIKLFISDYYKSLQSFYGLNEITKVLSTVSIKCKNIVKLSEITPSLTTIKSDTIQLIPIFNERTSKFIYEYYLLKIITCYIELTDNPNMIVHNVVTENTEYDLVTREFLEDEETKVQFMEIDKHTDTHIVSGDKLSLKKNISGLLCRYIGMLCEHKDTIDITYDTILDRIFKLKSKEKDSITDRLQAMTDESRNVDNVFKVLKLGTWGKGIQKGLTRYDKETYDEESELRDKMAEVERKIRNKNPTIDENDMEYAVEDYLEEERQTNEIENEVYDMSDMNDDYYEGNYIDHDPVSDDDYN